MNVYFNFLLLVLQSQVRPIKKIIIPLKVYIFWCCSSSIFIQFSFWKQIIRNNGLDIEVETLAKIKKSNRRPLFCVFAVCRKCHAILMMYYDHFRLILLCHQFSTKAWCQKHLWVMNCSTPVCKWDPETFQTIYLKIKSTWFRNCPWQIC